MIRLVIYFIAEDIVSHVMDINLKSLLDFIMLAVQRLVSVVVTQQTLGQKQIHGARAAAPLCPEDQLNVSCIQQHTHTHLHTENTHTAWMEVLGAKRDEIQKSLSTDIFL